MISNNGKQVKLGNVMISNPKITLKKGEVYDFVEMQSVKEGCHKSIVNVDMKVYKGGTKFQNGDIIFARITPCLQNGKISKIKNIDIGFGSTEYFVFRNIEGVTDSDYLFYLLITEDIRKTAEKSMVGASGRQRANIKSIEDYKINLPPLPIQQKIANILSKYDDLIENNTRRIKILEEQAQLIYNEWFVKFKFPGHEDVKLVDSETEFGEIPEGWEVKKIGDCISDYIGGGWGKEKEDEKHMVKGYVIRGTNIPLLKKGDINNIVNRFHTHSNIKSRLLEGGDIVFEVSGGSKGQPVGRCILMNGNLIEKLGNSVIPASFCKKIRPKKVYSFYLYKFFEYIYANRVIEEYQVQSTGITNFKFESFLSGQDILLPHEEVILKFNNNLSNIYDAITLLGMNNQNLKETRDMLIPKLVNGEVEV